MNEIFLSIWQMKANAEITPLSLEFLLSSLGKSQGLMYELMAVSAPALVTVLPTYVASGHRLSSVAVSTLFYTNFAASCLTRNLTTEWTVNFLICRISSPLKKEDCNSEICRQLHRNLLKPGDDIEEVEVNLFDQEIVNLSKWDQDENIPEKINRYPGRPTVDRSQIWSGQ